MFVVLSIGDLETFTNVFFFQVLHTNQFSVTKHRRTVKQVTGAQGLPGIASLLLKIKIFTSVSAAK